MGVLTGHYEKPDGAPARGTLTFTLTARVVADDGTTKVVVVEGPVIASLTADGSFTAILRPTDDPEFVGIEGELAYNVHESVEGRVNRLFSILLPAPGPWDIADVAAFDEPPGVIVKPSPGPPGPPGADSTVPGPPGEPGPPGPTAVSADADNAAVLGSDDLIYVPVTSGSGGGGEVDWTNVPAPVTIKPQTADQLTSPPLGVYSRNSEMGNGRRFIGLYAEISSVPAYPTGALGFEASGFSIEAGNGASNPTTVARFDSSKAEFQRDIWFSDNARAFKFTAATFWDTILKAGAAAGELTINDKRILVEGDATGGGGDVDWANVPDFTLKPTAASTGITLHGHSSASKSLIVSGSGANGGLYLNVYDTAGILQTGASLSMTPKSDTAMGAASGFVGGVNANFAVKQLAIGAGVTSPLHLSTTGSLRFNATASTQDNTVASAGPGVLNLNSKPVATVVVSATAPATPAVGTIWVS